MCVDKLSQIKVILCSYLWENG